MVAMNSNEAGQARIDDLAVAVAGPQHRLRRRALGVDEVPAILGRAGAEPAVIAVADPLGVAQGRQDDGLALQRRHLTDGGIDGGERRYGLDPGLGVFPGGLGQPTDLAGQNLAATAKIQRARRQDDGFALQQLQGGVIVGLHRR
jgi:hypothetical protein